MPKIWYHLTTYLNIARQQTKEMLSGFEYMSPSLSVLASSPLPLHYLLMKTEFVLALGIFFIASITYYLNVPTY